MEIDKRYFLEIKFTSSLNESYTGQIIGWEGHMAHVAWPKRTVTTLAWRKNGWGISQVSQTLQPSQSWVNPEGYGFEVIRAKNLYNLALDQVNQGLAPGQNVIIWQKGENKATIFRETNQERINLVVEKGQKSYKIRFAHYGQDTDHVSGLAGKWIPVSHKDYLKWVENTK